MDLWLDLALWVVLTSVLTVVGMWASMLVSHWRFARYHRYKGVALPELTPSQMVRLHVREGWAWFVLAAWVFRGFGRDGLVVPEGATGVPVLCVHGFTQNGTNWLRLRRRLQACGRATRAVYLGPPPRSLSRYQPPLEQALDAITARFPDQPVDVVCHSMGGIILRMVLRDRPDLAGRVRRVVTLGSPHAGTAAPRGFAWLPDVRGLSRRSVELAALADYATLAPQAEVTTVAARRDFIVYPYDSALLPGTAQVIFEELGHMGLLVYPEVHDVVLRALDPSESAAVTA